MNNKAIYKTNTIYRQCTKLSNNYKLPLHLCYEKCNIADVVH